MYNILSELDKFVKEGIIRTIGLSNETAWGTINFLILQKKIIFQKL